MNNFFNMSGNEMILISALTAILLAEGLTTDEQRTLADFLTCIGQNLMTNADQKDLREKITESTDKTDKTYKIYDSNN